MAELTTGQTFSLLAGELACTVGVSSVGFTAVQYLTEMFDSFGKNVVRHVFLLSVIVAFCVLLFCFAHKEKARLRGLFLVSGAQKRTLALL